MSHFDWTTDMVEHGSASSADTAADGSAASSLKIYGERNTGSRYLTQLCRRNLDVEVLRGVVPRSVMRWQRLVPGEEWVRDLYFAVTSPTNLGWKHRLVDTAALRRRRITSTVHFVAVTKNPYSWLLSLARRPYNATFERLHPDIDVSTLCECPWPTMRREGGPRSYDDAVSLWNAKHRSYVELAGMLPTTVVRYEDLVVDPAKVIGAIARDAGLPFDSAQFVNVRKSTKERSRSYEHYREYYGNERWRDELTAHDLAMVGARLDRELMRELGYELLG